MPTCASGADRFEAVMFPGGAAKAQAAFRGGSDKHAAEKPPAPPSYLGRLR